MSQDINISTFYTYTKSNPVLGAITISTELIDGGMTKEKPRHGGKAFSTQKILNNFPGWVDMRNDTNSIGQQLINAWGRELDQTISLHDEYRASQFISTADTFGDINTGISDLSFSEYKVYEPRLINLLFNSSFTMKGAARLQKPEGWKVERYFIDSLSFQEGDSLFGQHSLKFDGSTGVAVIKQTREYIQTGGHLNLSVFVKTLSSSGNAYAKQAEQEAGILLIIYFADGSLESYGLGFPENTSDEWTRASFSVDITKKTFKYEVIILNRTGTTYLVDLPQLEIGRSATNWTPSILDTPIYFNNNTRNVAGMQILLGDRDGPISKLELLPVGTANEFQDLIIPTRLEPAILELDPGNSLNYSHGQEVTYAAEILNTKWVAEQGSVVQRSISTPDMFGNKMLPVDLYMGEEGRLWLDTSGADSENVKVYATNIYKDWLFIVTKELYLNKERYVLKFAKPEKLNYADIYLQSYADIEIPIDLAENGQIGEVEDKITKIGICKNIPYTIFIDTNLRKRFYFNMKFDYAYADFRQRKLYCRNNYVANGSRLQVI